MPTSDRRVLTIGQLIDEGQATLQTGPFGSQLHASDYVPSGTAVIPTEAIGRRTIRNLVLPQVSTETAARLSRHTLLKGDILFARRGVQATGLSALVSERHSGALCGTGAIRLRFSSADVDSTYVSFWLSTTRSIEWIKAHAVGGVMPNVNESVLRLLPIELPSMDVQRDIAALLGSLDDKIALNSEIEQAVRDLVDDAVESEGVVDIFKAAGLPRADISVLDESFLQTFKDKPQQNLRLMLLEQLLSDEIRRRQPRNLAQAKSFRELLEKTLQRYHNRLIDAATVVAEMLRMKRDMDASDARACELGLQEEEVSFYDAVAASAEAVYDQPFLRGLVHDVVQTIKRNLKVDWTEPHRDQVRAEIRAAVKRVLRKRGVREADFEPFIARFMEQAEAQYAEWPLVA